MTGTPHPLLKWLLNNHSHLVYYKITTSAVWFVNCCCRSIRIPSGCDLFLQGSDSDESVVLLLSNSSSNNNAYGKYKWNIWKCASDTVWLWKFIRLMQDCLGIPGPLGTQKSHSSEIEWSEFCWCIIILIYEIYFKATIQLFHLCRIATCFCQMVFHIRSKNNEGIWH